jgi:hypothetical protein
MSGALVGAVAFFSSIILIAAIIIFWSSIVSTIQVSNVNLYPSEILVSDHASLSFTVKNNDAKNQHNITVTFNVTSVTFKINNEGLHLDGSGVQYYNIQLPSSQQSTYNFEVTATLTGGASRSTYPIRLNFYDENYTRFDSKTQSLTVNSG